MMEVNVGMRERSETALRKGDFARTAGNAEAQIDPLHCLALILERNGVV
jgi:hypothetical protein